MLGYRILYRRQASISGRKIWRAICLSLRTAGCSTLQAAVAATLPTTSLQFRKRSRVSLREKLARSSPKHRSLVPARLRVERERIGELHRQRVDVEASSPLGLAAIHTTARRVHHDW